MSRLLVLALLIGSLAGTAQAQGPGPDEPDPGITDGTEQRRLDAARAQWRAAGPPRSYDFRVRLSCFCSPETTAPRTIKVRRSKPVRPPSHLRDVATVLRLFREIQEAIDGKVASLSVVYGSRGMPRQIAIDRSRLIADEESYYSIDRFRRR